LFHYKHYNNTIKLIMDTINGDIEESQIGPKIGILNESKKRQKVYF